MSKKHLKCIKDLHVGSLVILENVFYFKSDQRRRRRLGPTTAIYIGSSTTIHGFVHFYLSEANEFVEVEKYRALRCLVFYQQREIAYSYGNFEKIERQYDE